MVVDLGLETMTTGRIRTLFIKLSKHSPPKIQEKDIRPRLYNFLSLLL